MSNVKFFESKNRKYKGKDKLSARMSKSSFKSLNLDEKKTPAKPK
jgi:hypothetical protein